MSKDLQSGQVKLSDTQKEVIELLRAGYTIYNRAGGYIRVAKTILTYDHKRIKPSTLTSLFYKGIIKKGAHLHPDTIYHLTELGKSITL